MRFTAEVVQGGRVTIPKAVRRKLDIEEGDFIEMEVTDSGIE